MELDAIFLDPFPHRHSIKSDQKISARDVTAARTVHQTGITEVETSNSISLGQVWDGKTIRMENDGDVEMKRMKIPYHSALLKD